MLRGPQTPGELNQRTGRLHSFAGLGEIHETLDRLLARELVERLGRQPGQKEERYRHLLGDDARRRRQHGGASPDGRRSGEPHAARPISSARVAALEAEVARLRAAVDRLDRTDAERGRALEQPRLERLLALRPDAVRPRAGLARDDLDELRALVERRRGVVAGDPGGNPSRTRLVYTGRRRSSPS